MKCALGRRKKRRRTREDDLAIRQSSSFIICDFIYVLLIPFTTNSRTKWWYGYLREGRAELLGSRCNSLRSLAMAIEGTDNVVHFWIAFTTLLMNEEDCWSIPSMMKRRRKEWEFLWYRRCAVWRRGSHKNSTRDEEKKISKYLQAKVLIRHFSFFEGEGGWGRGWHLWMKLYR